MMFANRSEIERSRLLLAGARAGAETSISTAPAALSEARNASLLGSWFFPQVLLRNAGLGQRGRRSLFLRLWVSLGVSVSAVFLTRQPLCLGFFVIALLSERFLLSQRSAKRTLAFDRDYTAFLISLASGVRTGLDPLAALTKCAHLFTDESLVKAEILAFQANINAGENESAAIQSFARSIAHPDLQLFRTGFLLARKEGSSLSECLHRLARVTRFRQSFRRKVTAALAMQKLSAIGITGCAMLIGVIQLMMNAEAARKALASPFGSKALALGASLMLIGLIWMLSFTRART